MKVYAVNFAATSNQELTTDAKMVGYFFHALIIIISVGVFFQSYIEQPRSAFKHCY